MRWLTESLRTGRIYPHLTRAEAEATAARIRAQGRPARVFCCSNWA